MMKKLINDPLHVVREMLEGIVMLSPGAVLLRDENVVVARVPADPAARPVAVISGGGSGHEPAHAGYVGAGMLSAAVCGEVFTSPSADAVLAAIRAVAGPRGALLIVKNYTGDRLNFGLAAELARGEGIPVEIAVIADDVSLRHTVEPDRRRGIAGTVLVHKAAGAAAHAGGSLAEVARAARDAALNLGTMGVALGGCTLPGADHAGFDLGADEIELGLGIHGEKGVERTVMPRADALVETLIDVIVADGALAAGERVALAVNGLGATPPMELAIVARAAIAGLRRRGLTVTRAWCGTLLSALDMPGCSLSVLRLDDARLALLDAPTAAPAWPGAGRLNPDDTPLAAAGSAPAAPSAAALDATGPTARALEAVAHALTANEATLTDLDTKAGDGDLGASMSRAAQAILAMPAPASAAPADVLSALGAALRRAIAGSSGPFYATALLRASRRLAESPAPAPADWADAFRLAVDAIAELGGAKPGERTMLDALRPASDAFTAALARNASLEAAWTECAAAARTGAEATRDMIPRVGRASYLGARAVGAPDGGAVAVAIWLAALAPFVK